MFVFHFGSELRDKAGAGQEEAVRFLITEVLSKALFSIFITVFLALFTGTERP